MNIFMIDNEDKVCRAVKTECHGRNVEYRFDFSTDLESGLKEIEANIQDIDLIILDGKGHLTKTDTTEKIVHVAKACSMIRRLSETVQIIIYSGFLDNVEEQLEGIIQEDIPRFDKSDVTPEELIIEVENRVNDSDLYLLKRKYTDLFSLFENGFMDKNDEDLYNGFIDILKQVENDTFMSLDANHKEGLLNKARKLQEHIYIKISKHYPHVIPDNLKKFNDKKKRLTGKIWDETKKELKSTGKVYQEQPIEYFSQVVNWNPGTYNHYISENTGFYTNYGFKAIAFSLFEVMMWYKNGIDTYLFNKKKCNSVAPI